MKNQNIKTIVLLLFCTVFSYANNLHAATFTVSNGNDAGAGSLRQAVLDANASPGLDVIDISPSVLIITLTSIDDIFVQNNLPTLSNVTINGNGVIIQSLVSSLFARAYPGTTLNNIVFVNFTASCLHVFGTGVVSINNCTFSNCINVDHFSKLGGAIHHISGALNIINTRFLNCSANFGGAIYCFPGATGLYINSCEFADNSQTQGASFGNAIVLSETSFTTILTGACIFSGVNDQDIARVCGEIPTGCQLLFLPPFSHTGTLVIN